MPDFARSLLCWTVLGLSVTWISPALGQGQITGTAFNPALSLILDGKLTRYSGAPPELTGVLTGGESGTVPEGFSLSETEIAASANVDDKFYGFVTIGSQIDAGETEVELEEAWMQTLTLPSGLSVKAGKFFSDIGYQNVRHPHTWDFVNAPLPYAALLGTTYADTGVQARWIAPAVLFVEVGGELLAGEGFPAAGRRSSGIGGRTLFARVGGELGVGHNWRAGLSYLSSEADGRESFIVEEPVVFFGDTDVLIADFVWKWARNGNPRDRNFTVVAEYLRREERGVLDAGGASPVSGAAYDDAQHGLYVYGTYQFRPRWRVGARYDRVSLGERLSLLGEPFSASSDPERLSIMADWSNSEYSRLRLQIDDLDEAEGSSTAVSLQYVMSLGSHGAHRF